MGFMDSIKKGSESLVGATRSAAVKHGSSVWNEYGEIISTALLRVAEDAVAQGRNTIIDDREYKSKVVDPLWAALPLPIRLIGRERLRWDNLVFDLRSKIFVVDAESVSLHPAALERINQIAAPHLGYV